MANLLAYGADVVGGFAERPPVIYSTDEQVIGEWIDGSTLYQKTIDFGALPNNTSKSVNHNISNLNRVVYFLSTAQNSSGTGRPIPDANTSSLNSQIRTYWDSTKVYIATAADQSAYTAYVTLQYTKS